MSKRAGLLGCLLLLTGVSFADQSIKTSTASGNSQTTIIDANGNLKVVESQTPTTTTTATQQVPPSINSSPHDMDQAAKTAAPAGNTTPTVTNPTN